MKKIFDLTKSFIIVIATLLSSEIQKGMVVFFSSLSANFISIYLFFRRRNNSVRLLSQVKETLRKLY